MFNWNNENELVIIDRGALILQFRSFYDKLSEKESLNTKRETRGASTVITISLSEPSANSQINRERITDIVEEVIADDIDNSPDAFWVLSTQWTGWTELQYAKYG